MLIKVISGGQTGADQAGLAAAKACGIATGGTAPPGFMTSSGPMPELKYKFGMVEGEADPRTYPKRTRKNVQDSDGTVLFGNTGSPGCKLTLRCCIELGKPHLSNPDVPELVAFIKCYKIGVLNVAGNRERTNPGIFGTTWRILTYAFAELKS